MPTRTPPAGIRAPLQSRLVTLPGQQPRQEVRGVLVAGIGAALQPRIVTTVGLHAPAPRVVAAVPVRYVVFDLLRVGGRSLLGLPYQQRRAHFAELGLDSQSGVMVPAPFTDTRGELVMTAARQQGLEGVAKRLDSVSAAHGGMACAHWWGTPAWPDLVVLFLDVLDDEDDEHWRLRGAERVRDHRPPQVNRLDFRRVLLRRPWEFDTEVADWMVAAGIGYLRHRGVAASRKSG